MASAIVQRILRFIGPAPALRAVDWRGATGYSDLSHALRHCDMAVDEFVAGPVELYFEWIAARPGFRGDQARIMQHVRGSVDDFRMRITPLEQLNLDRQIETRLGDLPDNDRWLLDVWDGVVGHHGV